MDGFLAVSATAIRRSLGGGPGRYREGVRRLEPTLDPDLNSYYAMDAVIFRLPEVYAALKAGTRPPSPLPQDGGAAAIRPSSRRTPGCASTQQRRELNWRDDGQQPRRQRPQGARRTAARLEKRARPPSMRSKLSFPPLPKPCPPPPRPPRPPSRRNGLRSSIWPKTNTELLRLLDTRIEGFESQRMLRRASWRPVLSSQDSSSSS